MSETSEYTVDVVGKSSTRMVVTTPPPATATPGIELYFAGRLEDLSGKRIAGKQVQLFLDGVGQTKATTGSDGSWRYWIAIGTIGTHKLKVKFDGDETYEPSETSEFTVWVV